MVVKSKKDFWKALRTQAGAPHTTRATGGATTTRDTHILFGDFGDRSSNDRGTKYSACGKAKRSGKAIGLCVYHLQPVATRLRVWARRQRLARDLNECILASEVVAACRRSCRVGLLEKGPVPGRKRAIIMARDSNRASAHSKRIIFAEIS